MYMVATAALQDGMQVGEDVVVGGNVIVKKGKIIDRLTVKQLEACRVIGINILEPSDNAKTWYEKVRLSREFKTFEDDYRTNLFAFKAACDNFVQNKVPFSKLDLLSIANRMVPDGMSGKLLFAYLYLHLPDSDDLSYAHGLNVAMICKVVSRWLGLSPADTDILIQCGFLYDVGKLLLPHEIIWKPDRLNKMELDLVRCHPFLGYHTLSKYVQVDQNVLAATLQHHERSDGSGYPQGLTADQINPFARIIAILDVYEAMTSARSYRQPMCPYQVIRIFQEESFQKYDIMFINTFLKHIVDELIGNHVRLNNGWEGEVIMNNTQDLSRPILKSDAEIIDMTKRRELAIVQII
ncbi:MAG: HD-GYP domain-containing protein [Lachnospiraceae bacterium]|nr:HD-GYP domain-containing protein [Lachnospiraceae bacterium]